MIRALIVDDEAPARARMRRLLDGCPVEVAGEAADGEEAIASAAALAPDVVFLDIQMPGLSGLDVAARLQAPRPRVVFCTAYDRFALEAFEHQAVDYLLKPVSRERLGRVVERIVAECGARRRAVHERQEAADVHARLMPPGGAMNGIECAARAVPADGVGGDYFDVLPMPDGRVALTVGDVSGKGLYAGILAAAVQGRMQSLALAAADPAMLLGELNRLSAGGLDPHRFVTLGLAVLAPKAASLAYAAAGHPPALLLRGDGTTERLDATGPVIGWPDAAFTTSTRSVQPGICSRSTRMA
jgi:CheY-like chemotaxis protein